MIIIIFCSSLVYFGKEESEIDCLVCDAIVFFSAASVCARANECEGIYCRRQVTKAFTDAEKNPLSKNQTISLRNFIVRPLTFAYTETKQRITDTDLFIFTQWFFIRIK